jgi:hypothetical protein
VCSLRSRAREEVRPTDDPMNDRLSEANEYFFGQTRSFRSP